MQCPGGLVPKTDIINFAHPRFDSGKGPVVVSPFLCLTMVPLSQNEQDHFNDNNNENENKSAKINKKEKSRLYTSICIHEIHLQNLETIFILFPLFPQSAYSC